MAVRRTIVLAKARTNLRSKLREQFCRSEGRAKRGAKSARNCVASWSEVDLSGGSMGWVYYSSRVIYLLYWFAS